MSEAVEVGLQIIALSIWAIGILHTLLVVGMQVARMRKWWEHPPYVCVTLSIGMMTALFAMLFPIAYVVGKLAGA